MDSIKQYLVPYTVSNILFVLCIAAAIKKPMWARIFLAVLFLWAAYINSRSAFISPEIYLDYARLTPVPIYREFIQGYFSEHITPIVLMVAIGEFFIFLGLLLNNSWVKMACIGGVIFGLAITPLGVGSAFPATISMSVAFLILLRQYKHDFIWNWGQYKNLSRDI